MVEKRDCPESRAEGLRCAIYKSGRYGVPENYRGITFISVLEKVSEIAVNKITSFVNNAFCEVGQHNGGFMKRDI